MIAHIITVNDGEMTEIQVLVEVELAVRVVVIVAKKVPVVIEAIEVKVVQH